MSKENNRYDQYDLDVNFEKWEEEREAFFQRHDDIPDEYLQDYWGNQENLRDLSAEEYADMRGAEDYVWTKEDEK